MKSDKVYLVTTGTGEDGNEWDVLGIFDSEDKSYDFCERWNKKHPRYSPANVEAWGLNLGRE